MNLKDHFIIAMPTMVDALFSQSVVYICEHNRDGAMGIIINKPVIELSVGLVLDRLDIKPTMVCAELEQSVFVGGPLSEEQGFILHTPQTTFASSIKITDELMITTSLDLLHSIGSPEQPKDILLALGYSGWQTFQLESEIARNDWLVAKANPHIIFDTPIEQRWQKAASEIGVNLNTISRQMGNA